ncbi:sodium/hydrogen exchanger 9B2-like [Liolophura sinensis]|uniref:sodium/hydrogen exchanger 9B2-like n=1 Tax=Liolophura sinensis TaxID=3198878 RepID=UPI003158CABE
MSSVNRQGSARALIRDNNGHSDNARNDPTSADDEGRFRDNAYRQELQPGYFKNGKDGITKTNADSHESGLHEYTKHPDTKDYSKKGCCARCCGNLSRRLNICCKPCMWEHHPLPPEPSLCQRFKYTFMCPPHGVVAQAIVFFITILIIWSILWSISKEEALPGGKYFGIVLLFPCCVLAGMAMEKIRLPPLLGMLLMGGLLANIPKVKDAFAIDTTWSAGLRNIALVVILIRAGLGLDPKALRKLSFVVLRLAFLPCLFEALTVAIAAHLLLGFPWVWGFILGFVHSAVSPAVVVPSMLRLQDQGLGTNKGIPTMIIAAGSLDDVIAISGFGIALGMAFSEGDLAFNIIRGPLEAIGGTLFGIIAGVLCWYIPPIKHQHLVFYRYVLLFGGGLFAVFGSKAADFPGAGALGCLTMAFVAAYGWRNRGWTGTSPMAVVMGRMWEVFQPLLFGLIGAAIKVDKIEANDIGFGTLVLFIGLVIRILVSFLVMFRTDMNWKERFFVPFAWLPKATVQAAIGSVALDMALEKEASEEVVEYGRLVLTMAVLIILITAPIGAIAIAVSGPKLLHRTEIEAEVSAEPEERGAQEMTKLNRENGYAEEEDV